ncbi:MAG: hypothetical protein QME12_08815 [Nanoarchaeota archaeon]|nr:hypothetical protein [Nanoarchaeota archaeon]
MRNQSTDDVFNSRIGLYNLMKQVVFATGYGNEEDDYTKTISLNLGGGTLSYDPYYDGLFYYGGDEEYEINDIKIVKRLIKEINRRFGQFENKVKAVREKAASEAFDKPIDKTIPMGQDG